MQCVELASLNPPAEGEYRVFNQFTEVFAINDLAILVKDAAKSFNIDVEIDHIRNPRVEQEEHYYNPKHKKLIDLGLKPHKLSDVLLDQVINTVIKFKDRIDMDVIYPTVRWSKI